MGEKAMTLPEITTEVQKGIMPEIDVKLAEESKKNAGAFTALIEGIKGEIKEIKDSFKPGDIAKQVQMAVESSAMHELSKMSRDEDEFIRALVCMNNPKNPNNSKALDVIKNRMGNVTKTDFNNITTAGDGGNVVPPAFASAVQAMAVPASVILQDAKIIPMGSGVGSFVQPTSLGGPTMYYPSEGSAGTASKASFGKETITPKLGEIIVPVSRQLLDMNNVGLVAHLARLFGEADGTDTDVQGFAGTDVIATGLRDDGALRNQNIAAATFAITLAELLEIPGLLTSGGNYKWYMHPSVLWARILTLTDAASVAAFKELWNQNPKMLLGFPVRECYNGLYQNSESAASLNFALLADLQQALLVAIPGGAQLSVSEQASVVVGGTTYNCFQQNLVAFRYSRYLGMAVPDFSGASLYPGVKVHSHA